jgi:hypothetical protein
MQAGIGIGIGIACLVLAALAVVGWVHRRRHLSTASKTTPETLKFQSQPPSSGGSGSASADAAGGGFPLPESV